MGVHFSSLSLNYQQFVAEYIISDNLAQSAKAANSKAKNLSQAGKQILNRKDVSKAVAEMKEEVAKGVTERLEISVERVLTELARIGFSDIRKLFTAQGKLIDVTKLDADTAAAISSIEVVTQANSDKVEYVHKIRTYDKRGPLESLGKHLGIFEADNLQQQYKDKSLDELKEERKKRALKLVGNKK